MGRFICVFASVVNEIRYWMGYYASRVVAAGPFLRCGGS